MANEQFYFKAMMKQYMILLVPLLSLAFNLQSELSENCHKKLIFCLRNLNRLNCHNPESFTICIMNKCSNQEVKVLVIMLCHVNSVLSYIEVKALSKQCSVAYRKCKSQSMLPLLLFLDRGETSDALCHAVTSEEFKDCLMDECNDSEKMIMISRSCDPWHPDKFSVDAIKDSCYSHVFKCLENATSPTCLTVENAETCLKRGCNKAEIDNIEILMCITHKTLLLYTNRIDEEIPECSAGGCSIKADYPVSLWMSPTELTSRICVGHYPKWESCSDPTSTECSPKIIQAITRDKCLPSIDFFVSESCEQQFDAILAKLSMHSCHTVRSAEDLLREKCTENEINILMAGSCESLRHSVFSNKHLRDSAPTCYERLLLCKKSGIAVAKLYDPISHRRNICWSLSLKSFETCLTSRHLAGSPCRISSMNAIISAGCRSRPGMLTRTCSQHALICIHGNIRSCADINAQENCLLETCTSIEANYVIRESCSTLDYLATLGTTTAEVLHECGQRIYYCLSDLDFPNHEWIHSAKVEELFCQVINTDIFIRCASERCSLQEINKFIQTTCRPHFHLLQSITKNCSAQIEKCGNLTLEAACAGLIGMEQCIKLSGQCSPIDMRRIIHQACKTLEAEDGFFLATQDLPPKCVVEMLTCLDNNKSLESFQATSADFCVYINSDVFKECVSKNCNSDHYYLTVQASCNLTAILLKVKPACYHQAMICFDSSTCVEADVNHNCLGSACTSLESIIIRDNFCKTERYIRRLESIFKDSDHCMSLFLDCTLRSQITVGMMFDLNSLQDRLCQASAVKNARQCYVTGANCRESLYELASVLACSPAGEYMTAINNLCIYHLASCLQLPKVASCADVADSRTCIRKDCNEIATDHVISRVCESMSYIESILDNIEVFNQICREKLQQCLQYQDLPITYWMDVYMFRRRVCHMIFVEGFKKCILGKCSKAVIKQIALTACGFRARILGLEQLSACSVFTRDPRFVVAILTLLFLSWWL